MELLLNESTAKSVDDFINSPSHCLILNGPIGSGKYKLSMSITSQILAIEESKLPNYPYTKHIKPDEGSISIDEVRELQKYLSLKTVSDKPISRIVIIENADTMTHEAQNAVLKTLEEPPNDTVIILTSVYADKLLPTVRSRAVSINVRPVSLDAALKYFSGKNYSAQDITKAFWLSEGSVGLLGALLEEPEQHPLALMINNVKELLAAEPYQRLIKSQNFVDSKEDLSLALLALQKIAKAGLRAASQKHNNKDMLRWSKLLAKVLKSQEAASANPSTKLLVTDLMLYV